MELCLALKELKVDLVVIQETKMRAEDTTPSFHGYNMIPKDKRTEDMAKSARGGALLILVREVVPFQSIPDSQY